MDLEWFRPLEISNRIRILVYLGKNRCHWVPAKMPSRRGRRGRRGVRRVPCPTENCELCADPDNSKPFQSMLSMVIDRYDGKIKMFEMRGQILSGLRGALGSSRIRNKDLSRFDVFITRRNHNHAPFVRYDIVLDRPKRLKVSEEAEARALLSNMVARLRPNCGL